MNPKRFVLLTENEEHKDSSPMAEIEPTAATNRWSTAVRSWVTEFQQQRHGESAPAFDSSVDDDLS